ncbi:acetate--CoA ligase [Natronospira bacteriovora]|uniref:acetate--CoA ligase n=1 Tax=Natronospira bacteriovora TaxID=3069753 RepID=A0ABU0W500_9GAMM|nr:acetate--CoA ligase [Natronospira sp. AB-CW4]MDQ2069029.1 acetate--CoA ligase [Natronospira sp. AB-CW4]
MSGRKATGNAHQVSNTQSFSWATARAQLSDLGEGRINLAFEALDRHMDGPAAERTALSFLARDSLEARDISYRALNERANRFANVLDELGIRPGERVYGLSQRIPDLYAGFFGAIKHGCVFTPLFPAFGPEPIRQRVEIGEPAVLVTTERLYRRKVAEWITQTPCLREVLLIGDVDEAPENTRDAGALMDRASSHYSTRPMAPDAPVLLHFTSGTTGTPKGALHVHEAVITHHVTGQYALDLRPGDVYWCTADPGWVTGTSYGMIAPLTNGTTLVVDEAEFDAERWYRILQDQAVKVWYTAPTAIRMLMRQGPELARAHDLSALRFLSSVGEPLNPEAVHWGREVIGLPFHDNWWQTETGGIMIANRPGLSIRPGSMGKPIPGIEAAIARQSESGLQILHEPDQTGELALKQGWPSMFRGYLNQEERYRKCFESEWYLTGDLARRDADGYYWFIGRTDDVIKSAGHLIGPFEVESALLEHPAVAEAGVIGVPDEVAGETVKAFVTLKPGHTPDKALQKALLGLARQRLGPAVAPRQIEFREQLPRTRSGKIMRRLLRARELGLPEGDLSTLEGGSND